MDDKLVHVGAYISEPLEKKMRITAATFGISKSEYIRVALEYLSNLPEGDLRLIYEGGKQKGNQNDRSTSGRAKA